MTSCTWYIHDQSLGGQPGYQPFNSFAAALAAAAGFGEAILVWGSVAGSVANDPTQNWARVQFHLPGALSGWSWHTNSSPGGPAQFHFASAEDALAAMKQSAFLPPGLCTSPMDCDPNALAEAAKCFRCLPPGMTRQMLVYLLCQWANSSTPPCELPAKATTPTPTNNAEDLLPYASALSWVNGGGATSYDVYFNGVFIGNQAGTTYAPGALDFDTDYTWRVDAVNACGTTTGDTWTFTTAAAFSYAPATGIITWTDVHGAHNGNLAFFNANSDFASVTLIDVTGQSLTSISNLSVFPVLHGLALDTNSLTTLDLTGCSALVNLSCSANSLTTLTLAGCVSLQTLLTYTNSLTSLDMSPCPALFQVHCGINPGLTGLDISGNPLLTYCAAFTCALTVSDVNNILSNLVAGGLTGGLVYTFNQTPAAPPSVGPPNGIAAKATLLGEAPPWDAQTD